MKRLLILILFATSAFAQLTAPEIDPNGPGGTGGNLSSQPLLVDHNGPRMPNAKVVYIFWGTHPPGYASELQAFRNEEGGMYSNMGMLQQYGAAQGSLRSAQPDIFDPAEPPVFTDDSSSQAEVAKWFAGNYDANTIYVLIIPNGHLVSGRVLSACGAQTVTMCAYHQSFHDDGSNIDVKYVVIPFAFCQDCKVNAAGIAATDVQNAEVYTIHEVREAMTDPVYLKTWYDEDNEEADDKCAFGRDPSNVFSKHTIPGPNDTPYYHPSRFFFFQKEW